MRLFLCLFCLTAAGVALLATPEPWLKLAPSSASGALHYWHSSLAAFAVPLSLFLLLMTRRNLIALACLGWGLWLTVLSLLLLLQSGTALPQTTPNGLLFVGFVLVSSLGTVLFAVMRLLRGKPAHK